MNKNEKNIIFLSLYSLKSFFSLFSHFNLPEFQMQNLLFMGVLKRPKKAPHWGALDEIKRPVAVPTVLSGTGSFFEFWSVFITTIGTRLYRCITV
jgi:hypothetical protein